MSDDVVDRWSFDFAVVLTKATAGIIAIKNANTIVPGFLIILLASIKLLRGYWYF